MNGDDGARRVDPGDHGRSGGAADEAGGAGAAAGDELRRVGDGDAARRYKDVIGELTTAADALRDRDRARAAALSRELVDLDDAMVRAQVRARMSRVAVELRWEAVLEALWKEQWMTLRPRPKPDPDADPDRLDALDRAADEAATELLDAARRRFLGLGGP